MSFSHQNGPKKVHFSPERGSKFKKSKKVPLDILEIHVVSKFGPIPMKIAACRCCDERQTSHTPYREVNLQNSIKPSTALNNSAYRARIPRPAGSEYSPSGLVTKSFAQIM